MNNYTLIFNVIFFSYFVVILGIKNYHNYNNDDDERELILNPLNNYFYLFIYLYLWLAVNYKWKPMLIALVVFLFVLILVSNITGMGPPLGVTILFLIMLMYQKVPIDEFKNSSNIEKFVHFIVVFVSLLMIYIYSNFPQPKMKGFSLGVLVFFLNAIAVLYGTRDTGIAPGVKLGRIVKWLLFIFIIILIVWYNTYGTVASYTSENIYRIFDIRISIRDKPDVFPFNLIPVNLIVPNDIDTRTTKQKAESSENEIRKEITNDYYN